MYALRLGALNNDSVMHSGFVHKSFIFLLGKLHPDFDVIVEVIVLVVNAVVVQYPVEP